MKQVQFVVTGRCEETALHHSIGQLFPELEFLRPLRLESFTSTPLTHPPKSGVLDTAYKFAAKLVEKVDEQSETLVVGIDDQESEPNPDRQVELFVPVSFARSTNSRRGNGVIVCCSNSRSAAPFTC